jgi:peptidoglycan-associated lipoprotein
MTGRRFVLFAVALSFATLGACKKDVPPPPPPPPAELPDTVGDGQQALDAQNRADSIRAAREAEEARQREVQRVMSVLTAMVFFEYDQSSLTPEGERLLRDKSTILRDNPEVRIRVEGHADERGSTEYNVALGNRRAESVVRFLTSFGLDASRFTTTSFGEERPMDRGESESSFARNRRGEFVVTAGEGSIGR